VLFTVGTGREELLCASLLICCVWRYETILAVSSLVTHPEILKMTTIDWFICYLSRDFVQSRKSNAKKGSPKKGWIRVGRRPLFLVYL
jgi:hypothetical protein